MSIIHDAGCLMVPLYFVFALFFGLTVGQIPLAELSPIDLAVELAGMAAFITSAWLLTEISHTLKELCGQQAARRLGSATTAPRPRDGQRWCGAATSRASNYSMGIADQPSSTSSELTRCNRHI